MKHILKLTMSGLLCLGFYFLQAQPPVTIDTTLAGRKMWVDSTSRPEYQTNLMVEKLSLTESQRTKVNDINMRYADKHKMMLDSVRGTNKTAMREKSATLQQQQDAELKSVLTNDQWNNWQKWQTDERAKKGDHHKDMNHDHMHDPNMKQTPDPSMKPAPDPNKKQAPDPNMKQTPTPAPTPKPTPAPAPKPKQTPKPSQTSPPGGGGQ